ncbi:MAG TPA: hypothetical protein ENH55_11740 [Aurantimonas coralicida]|uniref:Uncharacterized protein n=2 Tax=root TaxID=1 RepID=A0A9C9NCR0_9HYPH|nr:hypothetical protein [Aurantimonas coralicida]HET99110.1 hypothetical protein [Aurantimonas coralicida]
MGTEKSRVSTVLGVLGALCAASPSLASDISGPLDELSAKIIALQTKSRNTSGEEPVVSLEIVLDSGRNFDVNLNEPLDDEIYSPLSEICKGYMLPAISLFNAVEGSTQISEARIVVREKPSVQLGITKSGRYFATNFKLADGCERPVRR